MTWDALVTSSFLVLVVRHLLLVAMHLLLCNCGLVVQFGASRALAEICLAGPAGPAGP